MAKTGYVYILTTKKRTALYVGVTSALKDRLWEHVNEPKGHAGRYNIDQCVYYEIINGMLNTIKREKQIKRWSRKKKVFLIETVNPEWRFLNDEIFSCDVILPLVKE